MPPSEEPFASSEARGPVTFLFTDIEGSTRRWERHPKAMGRAVARHDAIMRAAITEHDGHVFKTVGDAFCAVFPSAEDAIAASIAAQKAIAEEDWGEVGPIRVRMGMHTGEAETRDNDFFGPTVNKVARIASAGHGGQTLLSSVTGEQAGERLPESVTVRDLGKYRLKDLSKPERLLQLLAAGLPSDFPKLKTVPSPTPGIAAAVLSSLVPLAFFRITNRTSSEQVDASLFSPLSIYTGLKGLLIELSTLNEFVLLAFGILLLVAAIGVGVARWRAARREHLLEEDDEPGRLDRWVVNQRTVAFLGVLALMVLGAYGYQQYLWRVALPIPGDAFGIALTREASAAVIQEELADSLYTQGQAEEVIIRELPVVFDARDTDRARELGERIDAHAVIIYRTDELSDGSREYIAHVVFTDPDIGLTLAGAPSGTATSGQPVVVKEGVPVPVLRTDTLEEMVNAAAGIIAYDRDQSRKAIEFLQTAVPADSDSANTGIVNFYLGNAYNLDNQPGPAATAYEAAAGFYERRMADGARLGPQDQLILAKAYMERGRAASFEDEWDEARAWYERAVDLRADLLARVDGLERPTDLHATYARLYTLMADAYRFMGSAEDQRSWEGRAVDEIDALVDRAPESDTYALVQQSMAHTFLGDCVRSREILDQALSADPADTDALVNAGVIALLQGRPDLARQYWQRILEVDPDSVVARKLLADSLVLDALQATYVEPAYMIEAEDLYRDITEIDPASVFAYESLASLTLLRAQGITIDSSAQVAGDDLSVARSQEAWPLDPDRIAAATAVYGDAIDAYRIIASELEPDSPAAAADVADAYLARAQLLYTSLIGPAIMGDTHPDQAELGEQILADAEQIRRWTQEVLDNPDARRIDTLRAWAARAEAIEREWGWFAFIEQDTDRAAELEREYREAVDGGLALTGEDAATSLDEIVPIRTLYFKASFITAQLDGDQAAADEYMRKIQQLTMQELQGRDEGITHYTTFCTETREQLDAQTLLENGDLDGAQEHYAAALEANPDHLPSLLGSGRAFWQEGDVDGANERATRATDLAPELPDGWVALAVYRLDAGDVAGAIEAIDRLGAALEATPAQARMHHAGELIGELQALLEDRPERAGEVAELAGPIGALLDTMPPEDLESYQYPALWRELGTLLLYADTAAEAEPLLRRSLELDPHPPASRALLVISLLAQDADASDEIDAALTEIDAPSWSRVYGYEDPALRREMMVDEVSRYLAAFPEREGAMEAFLAAIERHVADSPQSGTGVDGSVYTSAAHAYTVTWDADWEVVTASTDAGTGQDALELTNGTSTVSLNTATASDTPADCLQTVLAALEGDPLWHNVVAARDREGNRIAGAGRDLAHAVFVDRAGSDVEAPSVYTLACAALPDPATHLLVIAIIPVETYENQRDPVNRLLSNVRSGETDGATVIGPVDLPVIDLEAR